MYEGGNGRLKVLWCSPGSVTLLVVVVGFEAVVVLVLFEFNLPAELVVVVELEPSLLGLVSLVDDELEEDKDLMELSMDNCRNPRIIG